MGVGMYFAKSPDYVAYQIPDSILAIGFFFAINLFLLPYWIAVFRNASSRIGILILTFVSLPLDLLFIGWVLWIACVVWAICAKNQTKALEESMALARLAESQRPVNVVVQNDRPIDTVSQLTALAALKASGALTEEEFAAQKAVILGK
jgi:hypothetical protein